MLILFIKSQLSLFDMPVHVGAHVRKDGTTVKPHVRIQKVAARKKEPTPQTSLFDDDVPMRQAKPVLPDTVTPTVENDIVEHTTRKGKVIRGIIRYDLTLDEAREIDKYTFRKDGGYFIREKHLQGDAQAKAKQPETRVKRQSEASAKPADQMAVKKETSADTVPAPKPAETIKEIRKHDRTAPFGVPAGITKGERRKINADVIKLLERGGPFSDDDLALMRQYSGTGGVGDSLNEYYTDPGVATSIWTALENLGFKTGTALEPSCATGVFMHTAPEGVRITGVELDPISAGVSHALHGDRHEIHTASMERFAVTDDRQFDVVIGNPPFGPRGYLAKDDKVFVSTAEQYFTDTALDKCAPGGLVALVLPTGILDSKSGRTFRENMLRKSEFLGAMRMPNTAFEHAHTEVTTDVVFLRKRPDEIAGALGTVNQYVLESLGVWDREFLAGAYFTGRGAENILGTMTEGWRAKAGMGSDITVEGSMVGVADAIAQFVPDSVMTGALDLSMQDILRVLSDDEDAKNKAISASARRPYANKAKVGDTKVVDGVTYVLQGDPPRWHRVDEFMQSDAISQASDIAKDIDRLMTGGEVDQPSLEKRVRAYVKEHGIPSDNPDLMIAASVDKQLFRLVGAVNRKGELSDLVLGKMQRKIEGGFDAVAQLLTLEREDGGFTAEELADRLERSVEDVTDQLVADTRYAYAGNGQWTTMSAYLTGDLWQKLDAARADLDSSPYPDNLQEQINLLEKTIDPKALEDVDIQMNSAFIPVEVLADYLNWRNHESEFANDWTKKHKLVKITFSNGIYKVESSIYGDDSLIGKYLNRTGIRKEDMPRINRMNEGFKDWLCTSEHRDKIEEIYNRSFRGYVTPEFSDDPIDVPGLATDRTVRSWRWSSLRRSLSDGKGIIADDVGLGKTLGGLLLVRMAKIQGRAKKPVIVVPKSVLANWFEETEIWFPGARILTIGANFSRAKDGSLVGKDDKASERKRKYHDMTQNDYDFIIISEPAFEEVDLDPIKKEEYYSQDFWVQRGEAMGNAGDKRRNAIREKYEQHIAQREFSDRTDALYFNDLGIDMLLADEMHHQKNLYSARSRFGNQPKFLGGQGLSKRSLDFNLKARWILDNNDGKNVFGLTATPTKNSPLEIYSMLSHVAPEAFERIGIRNSEEFLDRFCEFTSDKILSTSGDIEDALVVSGFKNMDELREIMGRYIDRRTADDVGLVLPDRQDRMHLVDMSPAQQEVYEELRVLALEAASMDVTGDAHIFSVMSKMSKAALDLSIYDPGEYADAVSPKYAELAKQCKEGLKEGGQIVFSEYVESHEKIAAALVDAGVKREEVGIINAKVAGSAVKRQNIANAFNQGKLKVVIGNVTMSEGMNLQKTTTDIHHMDVPWEPATLQQRNGRGLRQGNLNEAVRIHTYLSKGSFDGYRYQSVSAKKDWQDLVWGDNDRVENLAREGAFSTEEMRIMLAADPDLARQKYDEDKTAAIERYDAGQREEAQSAYVRYAEMRNNYQNLKNKDSKSARMLLQRIESAKASLLDNKYWPAKSALDTGADVLIHPQTGTALNKDVGLVMPELGKMVVDAVDMRRGTVKLRHYASTSEGSRITLTMDKINDAKPFAFDSNEEAKEIGRLMIEAAKKNVNNIRSWSSVAAMPSVVLEANRDLIQRQMKDGAKSHTFNFPYGTIAMVDKETGKLQMVEDYKHHKMHDTHDYLLPTDDAREKVIEAWVDARRNSKITTEKRSIKVGRNLTDIRKNSAREYADANVLERFDNPFKKLLATLSGQETYDPAMSSLEREARSRLLRRQTGAIKGASTMRDAFEAITPLAEVEGSNVVGYVAKYPQRPLMDLWARASRMGVLGDKVANHSPESHDSYAFGSTDGGKKDWSVHSALVSMARLSGFDDLSNAMVEIAERRSKGINDTGVLEAMTIPANGTGPTYSHRTLDTIERVADSLGVLDKTVFNANTGDLSMNGPFKRPSKWSYTPRDRTVRDVIEELRFEINNKEAA